MHLCGKVDDSILTWGSQAGSRVEYLTWGKIQIQIQIQQQILEGKETSGESDDVQFASSVHPTPWTAPGRNAFISSASSWRLSSASSSPSSWSGSGSWWECWPGGRRRVEEKEQKPESREQASQHLYYFLLFSTLITLNVDHAPS